MLQMSLMKKEVDEEREEGDRLSCLGGRGECGGGG